jgi:signal transduction histidine kinase
VSPVTDHHDNEIGRTLSLRDITERNLREQRLAVLNRVLRHNLRNEVDVLKSHAEMLDEDDEEIAPILESADAIGALGQQARRIDQYISGSPDHTTVDLNETVQSVLDTVGADDTTVDISVDIPSTATLVTNRSAVIGAVESALDNAVRYADSTVSVTAESRPGGFCLRVTDDGPGIPDWELESLDAGTESPLQHTTGLGLWQLKWAVRALNGDLSFDTADGTTVEIFVPDRSSERTTA